MKNRNNGRVKIAQAKKTDGDAGTSPENEDGGRPETEEDDTQPGASDGAGQTKGEQERVAEVPVRGITGQEVGTCDRRFRATRGWS